MKNILEKSLKIGISYQEYKDLVHNLLAENKSTGPNQSEDLTNYSLLNATRMKRLDKTMKLTDEIRQEIQEIKEPQTWLLLTESWCGDAAQNLPIIHKMASLNENIHLKIVLRDENLELMDLVLTNGAKSIPKLIALDKDNHIVYTWGPRPTLATKLVADYKAKHGLLDAQLKEDLQIWYNKDKGKSTQEDFIKLIKESIK
jgi:hypothetical protein